jgi:signal transduction histidine kinase
MEYESRGYAAQRLITRLFYRNLFGYLVMNAVVMWGFDGPHWAWIVLFTVEAVALLVQLSRNGQMIRRVLTPLAALEETADMLGREDVKLGDLRRLVEELDEINAAHLSDRLDIPGGQKELVVLAEAINAMLERIEHSYQAQSRFVSDASHELRTPIAVIQGYANMLDRWGKNDPEAAQESINAIRQEAESMSALVQNQLFLARGDNQTQKVQREQVNLSELADEVLRETQLLETGRIVSGEIYPLQTVQGDVRLLKQAMRILVDNAVKYTQEGGEISIRLQRKGVSCAFSVTDTGPGIPKEELPKVFERFYRTDLSRSRESGGTGLGLSIAQWIAQQHNGSIELISRSGVGSRFTLLLPLAASEKNSGEAAN